MLLVDDIQFLAKREETQTEFFHTFNHLHGAGKQIVIASDHPPHELSGLEERLVSRFRWGLCVDVQPPDLETRIAILQLKAERERITVPSDVIEFAASKFDQSVRELEGALVRVVAWSELTGQQIDVTLAERALQDLIPQNENEIPPPLILEETAKYFTLSTADLISKSRSRPLTHARHIAMYLTRECTGLSLVKIGEIFGGRDHTTVLHGIKKVEDEMRARDATFRQVTGPHPDRARPRARCRMSTPSAPIPPVDNLRVCGGFFRAVRSIRAERHVFPTRCPHVGHRRYAAGTGCLVHLSTVPTTTVVLFLS